MTRLPERRVDHLLARLALDFADVHDDALVHLVERDRHHAFDAEDGSLDVLTHDRIVDSDDLDP